jgi:hypothetical protein
MLKGIDVYVYGWMNTDTREAYYTVFKAIFKALAAASNTPVQFQHIHGAGLCTVSVDMCNKQAGGKI